MAYSKAKLKSSGDKASPCFRPFRIRKLSDVYLYLWILEIYDRVGWTGSIWLRIWTKFHKMQKSS
jgi:hypothetical protein